MGKTTFQDKWMLSYPNWLMPVAGDKYSAKCKVCQKTFSVSNMGKAAIESHAKSDKHVKTMRHINENISLSLGSKKATDTTASSESSAIVMNSFINSSDVLSAEIWWAMKCVTSHYSFNSCSDIGSIFKHMFPDSKIADKFSCGENKCSYFITFGIGPYIGELTLQKLKTAKHFILMFDESHNDSLEMKQMDIHVRFWDDTLNQVVTKYLDSIFMGHGRAEDLLEALSSSVEELSRSNILQLSMDGPNVNKKVLKLLINDIETKHDVSLIDIGSCSLHTVHNAFKNGAKKADFNIAEILKALHWLFKESPARREDFIKITDCQTFPLPFCGHRWIENQSVAKRAFEIWTSVVKFVQTVEKNSLKITCNSFKVIREAATDPLIPVKIAFFEYVSTMLQPFLEIYQSDRPLTPFLTSHIEQMIRRILRCVLKPTVLKDTNTTSKLTQLDLCDVNHLLSYKQVDLGFKSEKLLKDLHEKKCVSDRDLLELRKMCQSFMVNVAKHLLNKTPINFNTARCMDCLAPSFIYNHPERSKTHLKNVLSKLIEIKRLDEGTGDIVNDEYIQFVDSVPKMLAKERDCFKNYDPLKSQRLDEFYYQRLHLQYRNLLNVVRMLLIVSHGQAAVERGFSLNKEIVIENLKAHSLTAQRRIVHHINDIGGLQNFKISDSLLQHVSSARAKYRLYLEEQRKKQVLQKRAASAIQEELSECKKRKKEFDDDIKMLLDAADEKAQHSENFKGQKMRQMIMESNALRSTGKEKQAETEKLSKQIESLEEELKSCD